MKHSYIKYEKLSGDIKQEIQHYHDTLVKDKSEATFDESMVEWFDLKFDEWLIKHYIGNERSSTRRKHFRLEVEIPMRVVDTLIESSREDTHALAFVGKIINISRGGLYFKYAKPIEISSIIKVNIQFSNIDKHLDDVEALAMVIRSDKIADEFGIGIMFSSIYGSNKEKLDLFILKNLSYYVYSE